MYADDLKLGDVLLFERGSKQGTLLGRLIRLITGSHFTHSAIVVETSVGRKFIAEQSGRVALTPTGSFAFKHPERVTIWRNDSLQFVPTLATLHAMNLVGTPYGISNLFEILMQHGIARLIPSWVWRPVFLPDDRDNCTCSGFVAKITKFGTTQPPAFVSYTTLVEPDDFTEKNGYRQIGVIDDGSN